MMSVSVGDVCKSKVYLSLERKVSPQGLHLFWGKTYNGTRAGLVVTLGRFVFLGHVR